MGLLTRTYLVCRSKLNAVLATLLVSVAPVFILPLIPLDHTPERQPLLRGTSNATNSAREEGTLTDTMASV